MRVACASRVRNKVPPIINKVKLLQKDCRENMGTVKEDSGKAIIILGRSANSSVGLGFGMWKHV